MPCDTIRFTPEQTLQQRVEQVRKSVQNLDKLIVSKRVRVKVGPQGAITFDGWNATDKAGVTDACAYRRLMVSGSVLAKMEIARAEQLAGRAVDKKVIAAGIHSHDGGKTWGGH